MNAKELAAKALAKFFVWKIKKWSKKPIETQNNVFKQLIIQGQKTSFGKIIASNKSKIMKTFQVESKYKTMKV